MCPYYLYVNNTFEGEIDLNNLDPHLRSCFLNEGNRIHYNYEELEILKIVYEISMHKEISQVNIYATTKF